MRYLFLALLLALGCVAFAQSNEHVEGVISYKSSQSIYVKFNNTDDVNVGDTLYIVSGDTLLPAIEVKHTSSLSVMGILIGDATLNVSDVVVHVPKPKVPKDISPDSEPIEDPLPAPVEVPVVPLPEESLDSEAVRKENIRGRLSVSMYQHSYGTSSSSKQRMRYTFSLQAKHIKGSRISAESYVSYRHQFEDWSPDNDGRSKALRVYSLAVKYDFSERTNVALGRKVNTNIANIGAIDGLQAQHQVGKMTFGGFAGSRPDYSDYGINTGLMQYGGFASFKAKTKHGAIQNSIALVEQRNNHTTDRRFTYVQHSSALTKSISLFASAEFDLYSMVDSVAESKIRFTSTYLSLQYRPSRKLTFYGSYDARNNVIYYETYKNFIDNLIEQETRQGLRFRATYRMVKYVTLGSSIGYRFQKEQGSNSMNMHYYLSHSRVPLIKASVMASAILLSNDYLHGAVYGVRISRDIVKQKVFGELEYRMVDYRYDNSERTLHQDIVGVSLSWRVRKKLSLSVDFEGVFGEQPNNRVHLNLVQRF
jgi:hypothetical protein